MKYIGAHVSMAGGIENAPKNAHAIGATAFALFTKNQRQWVAKPYTSKNIDLFNERMEEYGYTAGQVLPHDGYLINLGNPDDDKREQSLEAFIDELQRCAQLGLTCLNMHPGSHLKKISPSECLALIAQSINSALDKTTGVSVLIENTAGQGTNLGYTFEQIAEIIDQIEDKERIGVVFDTCHAFAAGYDLRTQNSTDAVFKEFDNTIGLHYLKGMHLNDAKSKFESRVDRHHSLGEGHIGLEPFKYIMNASFCENIPLVLETIDESIWPEEITLLKSFENK